MKAGAPVVLLHASGSSSAQWSALAAHLAPRHEVQALDLIGYGGASAWTGRGKFCLADEAAPIRSVLGRLGQPAHLVGHSYGGAVALHLARVRPEYVRTLTVIEPVAFHLLGEGDAEDHAALHEITEVANGVTRALAEGDLHEGFGRFVDYWNGTGAWARMPPEKQATLAPLLRKVALDFEAILDEPAGLEDMADIHAPALIVQGGRTPLPTRCICRLLSRAIQGARLRVVPGAGHMLPLTHCDEVIRLVAAHIARRTTAAADLREQFLRYGIPHELYALHVARARRLRATALAAWTTRLARRVVSRAVSLIAAQERAPRARVGRRRRGARQGA